MLNDEEKAILLECRKKEAEIDATPEPPTWKKWEHREWEESRTCGPRYSTQTWFGGDDPIPDRYRTRYLRSVWLLASRGYIVATRCGKRLASIKLTESGKAAIAADEGTK